MVSEHIRSRVLLLTLIGTCDALRLNVISIRDAEHLLFSPYFMSMLSNEHNDICDLVHAGTELEDIRCFYPERFFASLNEIQQAALVMLSRLDQLNYEDDPWIDALFNQGSTGT